jgi:hypothetical protein
MPQPAGVDLGIFGHPSKRSCHIPFVVWQQHIRAGGRDTSRRCALQLRVLQPGVVYLSSRG